MTPEERAGLACALAKLNAQCLAPTPLSQRRRRLVIAASLIGTLVLAVWIGVLEVKLPRYYRAGGWRAAWVGFDIALLLVFAATAWAAWRRRQILIVCLMVLATLLVCDAWFDTTLDWGTKGFTLSLLSALLLELPLAVVPVFGDYPGSYRTLLRKSPDHASADVGDIPEITDVPQVTNVSEVTDVPEVRK